MCDNFIHLHNHTTYSLLDGFAHPDKLIKKALEFNMPAVAITDHGNMFGVPEFYRAAQKQGIKPIIGMEAYIAPGSRFDKTKNNDAISWHLLLIAKNEIGYRNLMKLSSKSYLEGFYYRPRIDKDLLRRHKEGLIVTSACIQGEVAQRLRKSRKDGIRAIEEYLDCTDDFYLEIQDHGIPEEAIYQDIYALSREMGIPTVATNDIHYLNIGDVTAHDIMLCVQTGKTVNDPDRMRYGTNQLYLKSPEEMFQLFSGKEDAIRNTIAIAESCSLDIEFGRSLLPDFPTPPEISVDDYLASIASDGAAALYKEITPDIQKRLSHELDVIRKTGFAGYFLIVADFIQTARKMKIPVGLGRGSAAGSIVSYCLGITGVDPLRYDLLFERFLNPERISMPDIDIDFCVERREEVIEYVRHKYGANRVAQIITFNTMASKKSIKDVSRALEIPFSEANNISNKIPVHQGKPMSVSDAFSQVPELARVKSDPKYTQMIQFAEALEGSKSNASVHAAGVIIAPDDITEFVPLFYNPDKGAATTQYDMTECERLGLLKMDFLGLRNLTVIDNTIKLLRKSGIEIDIDNIPLDDEKTFQLFQKGNTVAVFQFESDGMQDALRKLKPDRIEDLIAVNAMYRPGPLAFIDTFIDRKRGKEKITYQHPLLEPILKETYGVIVYQEQVMRIAHDLAGYSLGEADVLRRAMGKKKAEIMQENEGKFIEGCKNHNIAPSVAKSIYNHIAKFAEYGFNKSHATAYAIIGYRTAFLKANYPAHFMAANMTSEIGSHDRIVKLMNECKRMRMRILPPDINKSYHEFTVEGKRVRFGLGAIKNVGRKSSEEIISERESRGKFTNTFELLARVGTRAINKLAYSGLVCSGALDTLYGNRNEKLQATEIVIEYGRNNKHKPAFQQRITDGETEGLYPNLLEYPDIPKHEKLALEKELLGFYLSGHPLDNYREIVNIYANFKWDEDMHPKMRRGAIGLITDMRTITDKKGRKMAFLTIEDAEGLYDITVFAQEYEKFKNHLKLNALVAFAFRVDTFDPENFRVKGIADKIIPIKQLEEQSRRTAHIPIKADKANQPGFVSLHRRMKNTLGINPVEIKIFTELNGETKEQSINLTTNLTDDMVDQINKIAPESRISLTSTKRGTL